jgi:hypothetical protein
VHSETPTDVVHLPNPLLPGFNPDPSCVQVDDWWYAVTAPDMPTPLRTPSPSIGADLEIANVVISVPVAVEASFGAQPG